MKLCINIKNTQGACIKCSYKNTSISGPLSHCIMKFLCLEFNCGTGHCPKILLKLLFLEQSADFSEFD